MINNNFNPLVIVKEDPNPNDPKVPLNSLVDCNMGVNGVYITNCGCSSTS